MKTAFLILLLTFAALWAYQDDPGFLIPAVISLGLFALSFKRPKS